MDLLKLKQGVHKYTNKGNARRRAKRRNIKNPASLTEEEIQDALRYCRTRASKLKKQAKSLRKVTSGTVSLWRKNRETKSVPEPSNKR